MPTTFATSGSTGAPKHFTMSNTLLAARAAARASSRAEIFDGVTSIFSDLSLKSTAGFTNQLWAKQNNVRFFNNGGGSIEATIDLFERENIDALTANPVGLLNYAGANRAHRFKAVLATGSPLTPQRLVVLQEKLGERVFATYGASEVGTIAIANAEDIGKVPGVAGRLCLGVSVAFDDGEVLVKTSTMIDGYDDPALTALYFKNGWFRPGDKGYMTDDGLLVLTGRVV